MPTKNKSIISFHNFSSGKVNYFFNGGVSTFSSTFATKPHPDLVHILFDLDE